MRYTVITSFRQSTLDSGIFKPPLFYPGLNEFMDQQFIMRLATICAPID